MLCYVQLDLAARLDDGKGLSGTVADIKDANKRGALHFAAREGKTEVCKYLLEELKLDVDTRDEDGKLLIRYLSICWGNLGYEIRKLCFSRQSWPLLNYKSS